MRSLLFEENVCNVQSNDSKSSLSLFELSYVIDSRCTLPNMDHNSEINESRCDQTEIKLKFTKTYVVFDVTILFRFG